MFFDNKTIKLVVLLFVRSPFSIIEMGKKSNHTTHTQPQSTN